MRVAHVMAGARVGGAELFFERLCAAQAASGDDVLPLVRAEPARLERLAASGLAPIGFGFGGVLDFSTRRQLGVALRSFAPQVTVAWMGRAARMTPPGDWALAGRLGGRYDLARFLACRHLIGNTRGLVAWMIEEGWPPEQVHHLPNFAPDLAAGRPTSSPVGIGLPDGARVVLAMGRLHPNKGFDVLIRAMARCPDAQLLLAGEGPEERRLRALAQDRGVAGRVRFLGWRDDQAGLLGEADLLCCPSVVEPLGNVVLEAFSAACPVVAAASDGPRELIEDGVNGVLVPVGDEERLGDAIGSLLADRERARHLAQRGRADYERLYATAPVLAAWHRTLSVIASEGGQG